MLFRVLVVVLSMAQEAEAFAPLFNKSQEFSNWVSTRPDLPLASVAAVVAQKSYSDEFWLSYLSSFISYCDFVYDRTQAQLEQLRSEGPENMRGCLLNPFAFEALGRLCPDFDDWVVEEVRSGLTIRQKIPAQPRQQAIAKEVEQRDFEPYSRTGFRPRESGNRDSEDRARQMRVVHEQAVAAARYGWAPEELKNTIFHPINTFTCNQGEPLAESMQSEMLESFGLVEDEDENFDPSNVQLHKKLRFIVDASVQTNKLTGFPRGKKSENRGMQSYPKGQWHSPFSFLNVQTPSILPPFLLRSSTKLQLSGPMSILTLLDCASKPGVGIEIPRLQSKRDVSASVAEERSMLKLDQRTKREKRSLEECTEMMAETPQGLRASRNVFAAIDLSGIGAPMFPQHEFINKLNTMRNNMQKWAKDEDLPPQVPFLGEWGVEDLEAYYNQIGVKDSETHFQVVSIWTPPGLTASHMFEFIVRKLIKGEDAEARTERAVKGNPSSMDEDLVKKARAVAEHIGKASAASSKGSAALWRPGHALFGLTSSVHCACRISDLTQKILASLGFLAVSLYLDDLFTVCRSGLQSKTREAIYACYRCLGLVPSVPKSCWTSASNNVVRVLGFDVEKTPEGSCKVYIPAVAREKAKQALLGIARSQRKPSARGAQRATGLASRALLLNCWRLESFAIRTLASVVSDDSWKAICSERGWAEVRPKLARLIDRVIGALEKIEPVVIEVESVPPLFITSWSDASLSERGGEIGGVLSFNGRIITWSEVVPCRFMYLANQRLNIGDLEQLALLCSALIAVVLADRHGKVAAFCSWVDNLGCCFASVKGSASSASLSAIVAELLAVLSSRAIRHHTRWISTFRNPADMMSRSKGSVVCNSLRAAGHDLEYGSLDHYLGKNALQSVCTSISRRILGLLHVFGEDRDFFARIEVLKERIKHKNEKKQSKD